MQESSHLRNTSVLRNEIAHQPPCHYCVLVQVVRLHLFIHGESPLNCGLAVREDKELSAKSPQFCIWLHHTAEKDIQPLLHGCKHQEVLTTALRGQHTVELLKYDISYDRTDEEKGRKKQ